MSFLIFHLSLALPSSWEGLGEGEVARAALFLFLLEAVPLHISGGEAAKIKRMSACYFALP
jgi:hypothetical protein